MKTLSIQSTALLGAVFFLQSCATSNTIGHARDQFYSGQPEAALVTLDTESVSNRDRLLAYLDKGLIAHTAGDYEQSIDAFKSASDLLDRLDFISVKEQSVSLVSNEWATTYKGEYSERLWIHTFQMMNFLLLNQPESAAVEARQAVQLYEEYGDSLKTDWYSRALIAMSFESVAQYDSAHIEYKKLLDDSGRDTGIARRAWLNAKRLGREADAATFKNLMSGTGNTASGKGELIVFVQAGSIPRKRAGELYLSPELYAAFPVYADYYRNDVDVSASVDALTGDALTSDIDSVNTQLVNVSKAALAARGKKIAAKQLVRIAAKQEIRRSLSRRSEDLGGLVSAALFILEQADTRSWETLPSQLVLVQVPLEPGQHDVQLSVRLGGTEYDLLLTDIDITARRNTYRSIRVGSGSPQTQLISPSANLIQ